MTLGFLGEGTAAWGLLSVIGLALLGLAYFFFRRRLANNFSLQQRSQLLSPAEKTFFQSLVDSLNEDYFVFAKVAILDVVELLPSDSGRAPSKLTHQSLNSQCFDFLLCQKHDLSIYAVVELEDSDANKRNREKAARGKLISKVCKSAELKIFVFDVRQDHQKVDIRHAITGRSSRPRANELSSLQSQFTIDNTLYDAFVRESRCPQCNGELVTKVAVKGKRIGEKFLMCRKFPYCAYRVAMSDKDIIDKMQKKSDKQNKQAKREGYSDWSRR